MTSEQEKLKQLLAEAVSRPDPAVRVAYLEQACAGDQALRARVEDLIRAYEQRGESIERTLTVRPSPAERPGAVIGRYKLLQEIGEGAFGLVFMAEQSEPVRRKVALKIIKAGMDTREVIARFEAERQALALMDHPGIAKVFDGGVIGSETPPPSTFNLQLSTSRPYFVMELVNGMSITDYCDQYNLSTGQRLQLFMKVCQGVQHAHQKGIIHRDLKPSNILVTVVDGEPVPKIIDFGIAKALGSQLTEKTLFTAFQQMIGTPVYMSPEQAELSGVDIDTRSDIYSLGVLLYELLTGATPFDKETLCKAGLDEIRRMIRETEPPKPSTRLRSLGQNLTEVAKRRQTEPATLPRLLCGELDWIVMKALEKDRSRRYETVSSLLQDVQGYLNHEPVSAGAPGTLYQMQKFVKRHSTGVITAAVILMLLLVSTIVSTLLAVRANRAERTQAALRQSADAEAKKSGEVAGMLKGMLKGMGPSLAMGRDTTLLREILERTARQADEELEHSPAVSHEIRLTLGETFAALGDFQRAQDMATSALNLAARLGTNDLSGRAQALHLLSEAQWAWGRMSRQSSRNGRP